MARGLILDRKTARSVAALKELVNYVFNDRFSWDSVPETIWHWLYDRRGHQSRFNLYRFFWMNGMQPEEIVNILGTTEGWIPERAHDNSATHYQSLMMKSKKEPKYFEQFPYYDMELSRWIPGKDRYR